MRTATEYKIVVTGLIGVQLILRLTTCVYTHAQYYKVAYYCYSTTVHHIQFIMFNACLYKIRYVCMSDIELNMVQGNLVSHLHGLVSPTDQCMYTFHKTMTVINSGCSICCISSGCS